MAQRFSALALGARGCGFESRRPEFYKMKSAYNILESNSFRTLILFFIYFFLFFLLAFSLRIIFNDDTVSIFIILFAIVYSFLSILFSKKISLYLLGAKKIEKKDLPEVYNLVENISIIAGLPKTPEVYIIETNEMNAFALGTHYSNYLIGLTRGIINKLNKHELEAVIAHEIAHIKNKDTRLMTIAVFLSGVFSIISEIVLRIIGNSRNNRSGRGGFILFLIVLIFILLSPIFATLVQLAISRKREYMADATSALLTRNPLALASALEKISTSPHHFSQNYPNFASLFIINPFEKSKKLLSKINNLFSTHPPVEERIKILKEMVL